MKLNSLRLNTEAEPKKSVAYKKSVYLKRKPNIIF